MAKKKKKQVIYPVFFMVLVTVVFVTALAIINDVTKDIIAKQEALKVKENILYVFDITTDASEEEITSNFDQYIKERTVNGNQVYYATVDGQLKGYAFTVSGPGLWGSMTGYAAVNATLDYILGVSFVSHSETPGLGGRIDELWFKDQFRQVPINLTQDSVIFRPASDGNIDAITGATLTSESVRVIINEDIAAFIKDNGGDL